MSESKLATVTAITVQDFIGASHRPPTLRDIQRYFSATPAAEVKNHVDAAMRDHAIYCLEGRYRTIRK